MQTARFVRNRGSWPAGGRRVYWKKSKMSFFKILALGSVTWLAAGSTAFADVQLIIRNGQVSLVAKDATVRQILTEWARVGQTKIVNVERIPGGDRKSVV